MNGHPEKWDDKCIFFDFISLFQADRSPLNNAGKGDEHVAKHRLHNLRSNLHLLSFPSRNPILYMWGGGTFTRKDARTLATLLAGIVVLLLQEM